VPRLDAERVALWRAFQTAGEVVSRSIEAEMFDEFHLALPQFDLLAALAQNNDQMRVKELCEILSAVPSSLSRRIDSLLNAVTSPEKKPQRLKTIVLSSCD